MMKPILALTALVLICLTGPGTAQQGAKYEDTANGRQAYSSHDIFIRREVNNRSAELGPPREVTSVFDSGAFRTRSTTGTTSLSMGMGALISEEVAAVVSQSFDAPLHFSTVAFMEQLFDVPCKV